MAELTAGVDLGGTKIQAVVVAAGQVVGKGRLSTPSTSSADVIAAVVKSVHLALEHARAKQSDLRAVGIGSPGSVDTESGHVSLAANVAGFSGDVSLGGEVSKALQGVPVIVENDVRAAVAGELYYGAGRRYDDFIGVFVGSGVGGGIVLNRALRRGRGHAGEIGHTTVKAGGRACTCGRSGCLEAYAGRISMERRAREHTDKGRKTKLFEIMERKGRERVTSSVIADALEQEDQLTVELVDKAIKSLGLAIANAQNLLDVQAIILGGGLTDRLGDPFVRNVEREMVRNLRVPESAPAVLICELGDHSGAIGATVIAEERIGARMPVDVIHGSS